MATITICSDFGAQKNTVWHCFHCLPIYYHNIMCLQLIDPMSNLWADLYHCILVLPLLKLPINEIQRRQWHPTPVLLPGKSHGWRSLVDYSPWGSKESYMTEWLHFHFHFQGICSVVKLLGHMVALFLVFKGISICFSIVAIHLLKKFYCVKNTYHEVYSLNNILNI